MDKRKIANQKVKDRLFAALIEFAGSKDWSRLSVTELIEQSGVARASFYRNFKSVEELVDYGIQQIALQLSLIHILLYKQALSVLNRAQTGLQRPFVFKLRPLKWL